MRWGDYRDRRGNRKDSEQWNVALKNEESGLLGREWQKGSLEAEDTAVPRLGLEM